VHGLSNWYSRSSAQDLATLSYKAMQLPKFRRIVATKFFRLKQREGLSKDYVWENT